MTSKKRNKEQLLEQYNGGTSMNVSISAWGKQEVEEVLRMLKNAGVSDTETSMALTTAVRSTEESYANEPDEQYQDTNFMVNKISGGINKNKKMYKPASDGDNPISVDQRESVKERIYRKLKQNYRKYLD